VGEKGRTWVSGVSESGWGLRKANSEFGQDVGCGEAKNKRIFQKCTNQAGMSMKTKGRVSTARRKAGML
jgi:hypothetical protein